MSDTPTPRTDEQVYDPVGSFVEQYVVTDELARQLERELHAAKSRLENIPVLLENNAKLRRELAKALSDSEILDWLINNAVITYGSFDLDSRESIRWAIRATYGYDEPCYGDPTTEAKEKDL